MVKKFFTIFLFLIIISSIVFASTSYEALFAEEKLSRGMTFYFMAFVLLLSIPFLNKYLKTIAFFMIALFLSRGLMRISDEQDPIRTFLSIEPGIRVGVLIVVPLILLTIFGYLVIQLLKKVKVLNPLDESEVVELIEKERKNGKTLEETRKKLLEQGYSLEEINKAIELRGRQKNV